MQLVHVWRVVNMSEKQRSDAFLSLEVTIWEQDHTGNVWLWSSLIAQTGSCSTNTKLHQVESLFRQTAFFVCLFVIDAVSSLMWKNLQTIINRVPVKIFQSVCIGMRSVSPTGGDAFQPNDEISHHCVTEESSETTAFIIWYQRATDLTKLDLNMTSRGGFGAECRDLCLCV